MGPALGPPLGGILVDRASWNWCFDINVGPGILSGVLLFALLRDPVRARKTPVDFVGLGLLSVGFGTMQYVLTEGERHYWFADGLLDIATVLCVASLISFVVWELFGTENPIVDLRVLTNRSVSAGTLLSLALGMVIFGSTYTLPQLSQGPLGFTPTLSGELFILRAIPIALLTPVIVRLVARFDPRFFLFGGFVLLATGTAIAGFRHDAAGRLLDVRRRLGARRRRRCHAVRPADDRGARRDDAAGRPQSCRFHDLGLATRRFDCHRRPRRDHRSPLVLSLRHLRGCDHALEPDRGSSSCSTGPPLN